MSWSAVHDHTLRERYAEVRELAEWSDWMPFEAAVPSAPREPGVYLLREPVTAVIRYVGMAGERAGGGRPQGLYGRLRVYSNGRGAISGFGEAALDRALADPAWLEQQLLDLRHHGPKRAQDWAREAVLRLDLEVAWSVTPDSHDARYLETRIQTLLRTTGLWNR
ncbi:hypothetical protein [Kribbella sp. CA-293567]|uniref:hypothetical protein n=1 Tax=Kribbella sp. CA-293567 TaxID=3002436 RepID=UPI0022DE1B9F|nr:hypothetical protein [Kribbella sp. CA-293567]WBQ05421.1 hypothetical protein OX958_01155 [Kribbella sp. CA-293567]